MTPPILLDLSRLISRAGSPTPTGIDRIELAYAEHLIARAGDRLGFVAMNLAGEIAPLRAGRGRLLVETLSKRWRGLDGTKAARRLGPLTRFATLAPPGRSLLPAAARNASRRPIYLLVSHQNLQHRERFARFKAQSGAAFVFFVHDLIPIDYPEYSRPGQAERHRQRVETICALADGVVVNSGATAASLTPCLARAGRDVPVLVAHPGVEFASAAPPHHLGAHPGAASAGPGGGKRPYYVCIGTIEPRKNHLLLLLLWRRLAMHDAAAAPRLVLVGARGWKNENVVDLVERCGALSGLVEEHNALPDPALRGLLSGARALLCPSFVEGYGLPIAEALALGVPVICSDIPAFREVGRGVPEFLDPLDGLGWLRAIRDYVAPDSPRRAAQLARLPGWRPARWDEHIAALAALLDQVSPAAPPQDPAPRGIHVRRGAARPAAHRREAQPC